MNPWIAKNLIYKPIYALRGESVRQKTIEIQAFHQLSADEMQRIQWEKMMKLLEYVFLNNTYYRDLFKRRDINIKEIRQPEDLARIPFLTKDAIRAAGERMISNGVWRLSTRRTGGSTGMPLKMVKDRNASAHMDALMYEVYGWHGIKMGDRQCRIWGRPLTLGKMLYGSVKDYILNRRRLVAFNFSKENCLDFYKSLKRFKPKYLYTVVNTVCEFTRVVSAAGLSPADLGLEFVLTTGEILSDRQRAYLHDAFQVRVINEYGATENGIIAFECKQGGMHLMNHNLYIEFLDSETGKPAAPGQMAEVVVTELHSYAFPFIRYKVGDLARPSDKACACGLALPIIEEVVGRTSELMILPDGHKLSSGIMAHAMTWGVEQFRTYQKSINLLEIHIKPAANFKQSDLPLIEKRLRSYLGRDISIKFNFVDAIPQDISGKFRDFISEIK